MTGFNEINDCLQQISYHSVAATLFSFQASRQNLFFFFFWREITDSKKFMNWSHLKKDRATALQWAEKEDSELVGKRSERTHFNRCKIGINCSHQ